MTLTHMAVLAALAACLLLLAGSAAAADRVYPNPESVEPLPVGAQVPAVTVLRVGGGAVDLSRLVAERGALLVFYRGGW